MKNLVKYDDRYFRVSLVDGRPVMTEATPEDIISHEFENMVILKDEAIDTSMFQEIIDKTRRDMHQGLHNSLRDLVLGMLGFKGYDNGKYIVDGFNSDKNRSPVAELITAELKKKLLEVELKKDFDITPLEKTKLRAAMQKEYKEQYERYIRSEVYKVAQVQAREHVQEIFKELADEKLKTIARTMVEQAIRTTK